MIRLIVMSDSHGGCYTVGRVLDRHPEAHYVIHLGHGAADLEEFLPTCRARVLQVAGNCDFCSHPPNEQEVKLGGEDRNTALLKALRPYLHDGREKRLDESIKLLQLIKLLPLIGGGLLK